MSRVWFYYGTESCDKSQDYQITREEIFEIFRNFKYQEYGFDIEGNLEEWVDVAIYRWLDNAPKNCYFLANYSDKKEAKFQEWRRIGLTYYKWSKLGFTPKQIRELENGYFSRVLKLNCDDLFLFFEHLVFDGIMVPNSKGGIKARNKLIEGRVIEIDEDE